MQIFYILTECVEVNLPLNSMVDPHLFISDSEATQEHVALNKNVLFSATDLVSP